LPVSLVCTARDALPHRYRGPQPSGPSVGLSIRWSQYQPEVELTRRCAFREQVTGSLLAPAEAELAALWPQGFAWRAASAETVAGGVR
jgi:hypothetical protein